VNPVYHCNCVEEELGWITIRTCHDDGAVCVAHVVCLFRTLEPYCERYFEIAENSLSYMESSVDELAFLQQTER
jgi:hypothetical protein